VPTTCPVLRGVWQRRATPNRLAKIGVPGHHRGGAILSATRVPGASMRVMEPVMIRSPIQSTRSKCASFLASQTTALSEQDAANPIS